MATTENVKKDDLEMLTDPIHEYHTSRSSSPLISADSAGQPSHPYLSSANATPAMYSTSTSAASTRDGVLSVATAYSAQSHQQSWTASNNAPRNADISMHMDEKKDDSHDGNMNELTTLATVSPPNESSVSSRPQHAATMKPLCVPETAIIKRPSPFDVVLEDNIGGSSAGQINGIQNNNKVSSMNEWHNAMFAQLLEQHAESFSLAPLSNQALIVQAISSKIHQANGRFLERYGKGWKEISGQPVMLGIAQALFHYNAQNNTETSSSVNHTNAAASTASQPSSSKAKTGQMNQNAVLQLYLEPMRSADTMSRKLHDSAVESSPSARRAVRVSLPMTVPVTSSPSLESKPQVVKKTQHLKHTTNTAGHTPKASVVVSQENERRSKSSANKASQFSTKSMLTSAEKAGIYDPRTWMAKCGTQEYMEKRAMEIMPTLHVEKLPRGVTIRPSGKWQAQFYFDGQSRYIGVFDGSYPAALAYECVHRLLATYRELTRMKKPFADSMLTKMDIKKVFDNARMAATNAVAHYKPTRDE